MILILKYYISNKLIVYQIQKCLLLLIHLFYLLYQPKNLRILNLERVEDVRLWKHGITLVHHMTRNQSTREKTGCSIANTAKIHHTDVKVLHRFEIISPRSMISIFSPKAARLKSSVSSSYKICTTRPLIQIKVKSWMLKF